MPHASDIRVRFAPSPTGDPHIGSMWTALFNWLYARHHGGTFVLRIEDTDQKRLVEDSTKKILEALDWYGLTPDEGPMQGGKYGPYVQSERLDIYRQHVDQLVDHGHAYYCFCTPERLEQLRADQTAAKRPPRYDKRCATLTADEVARRRGAGEQTVIRMNIPSTGTVEHDDVIRGRVIFKFDQIDDSVIMKSDGFPTYHLANVVDDHVMAISHVIRAEEWLPSVPKHLFLYCSFGWTPPQFAHLPLLLGSDRSKLSKRHGATSALSFRDEGYLPETMVNFMALMGWHPKGEQEQLDRQQLVSQFDLSAINPSGAVFDRTKLDWLNGVYIRSLVPRQLLERLRTFWHAPAKVNDEQLLSALQLVRDRLVKLSDIDSVINFVWPDVWDAELTDFDRSVLVPKKGTADATQHHLAMTATWLAAYTGTWTAADLKPEILAAIAKANKKNGEMLWPLRVALSLRPASPDVFDLLELLGREESLRRIKACVV